MTPEAMLGVEYVCTHCGTVGSLNFGFRMNNFLDAECVFCDSPTLIVIGKSNAIAFLVDEVERLTEERETLIEKYEAELVAKDVRNN